MMRIVLTFILGLQLSVCWSQLRLVEDACPGEIDGVWNVFNLNGQICTFGPYNTDYDKAFRFYTDPLAPPDTLSIPGVWKGAYIYQTVTEPRALLSTYGDYYNFAYPVVTNQISFSCNYGGSFVLNEERNMDVLDDAWQGYDITAVSFHPTTKDLYFAYYNTVYNEAGEYDSTIAGIYKRDKISGQVSEVFDLLSIIPPALTTSPFLRQMLVLKNHLIFKMPFSGGPLEIDVNALYSFNLATHEIVKIVDYFPYQDYGYYEALIHGDYAYITGAQGKTYIFDDTSNECTLLSESFYTTYMSTRGERIYPYGSNGAFIYGRLNSDYGVYLSIPGQPLQLLFQTVMYYSPWIEVIPFKGEWYFINQKSNTSFEVLKWKENQGVEVVFTSEKIGLSGIAYSVVAGSDYFFFQLNNGYTNKIVFSDGTANGTDLVNSDGYYFMNVNMDKISIDSHLYVSAQDMFYGRELFCLDEHDLKVTRDTNTYSKNLVVYPNPNQGIATFSLPLNHGYTNLDLYNSSGQLLSKFTIVPNTLSFDLIMENLPRGVYVAHLVGVETARIKLVKE